MRRYIGLVCIGVAFALATVGCRDRYFSDRNAVIAYLHAHEHELEVVAESWAAGKPPHARTFCNFGPGSYRWGNVYIRKVADGFTVEGEGKKDKVATLADASMWASAPVDALSHWIDVTTRYKLYCLEDGIDSTVQILLVGSEWSPYGLRYAPKNDSRAFEALSYYARQGGTDSSDRRMDSAGGRWFYFEAKR